VVASSILGGDEAKQEAPSRVDEMLPQFTPVSDEPEAKLEEAERVVTEEEPEGEIRTVVSREQRPFFTGYRNSI
jgi:hypothetical protein